MKNVTKAAHLFYSSCDERLTMSFDVWLENMKRKGFYWSAP